MRSATFTFRAHLIATQSASHAVGCAISASPAPAAAALQPLQARGFLGSACGARAKPWVRCESYELAALDVDARRVNQDDLEKQIASWTSQRSCTETMATCQAAGIPAHRVQNTDHCLDDPQLAHRNHFIEVGHPTQGTTTIENTRFVMSRTPAVVTYGGPTWGEHNWEILTEELGYDPERIAELAIAEVLG